ncbi:ABC transporter ATP-binding protein/permease [Actinomadura madurae]|uniref:ABC transporter ATP-binding protein n=1 Tax=Actinomadura madurae TaxID=1993 RepID=UPI0020D25A42|nr:ABC transporter ATP-binding protein [Actinomadura madurae]MCP9966524.1 ABC transporter ATP-binding protein/permease [Actinomadura madurae]
MIRLLLRVLGPEYARPVRRALALMTATAVLEGLSYALLIPVLRALFGSTPADARPWLVAFGAAVAVYAVLRYVSDLSGFRAATTLLRGTYRRLGDHLARLPIGWHHPGRVGEVSVLASRGVLQAMSVIAHLMAPLVSAAVTPLTIVVVMLAFNWRMGLAALLAVPVVAAIQVRAGRSMAAADAERAEHDREATGRVIEYLQAQPVLRAGRPGRRTLRAARRLAARRPARVPPAHAVGAAGGPGPDADGAGDVHRAARPRRLPRARRGHRRGGGPGDPRARRPLRGPAAVAGRDRGRLRGARSELARLDAVLRTEPLPEPSEPIVPAHHDLEFESVVFRHGDRTVLDDVSLSVPAGQRLAIVGPSGAGKSSLLQLLARFYDVDGGAVRVGGADVRDITTEELMSRIAIVFQDVYLFDGTIEENVRLGRPDATEAEVRAAASAARLDEVVERLPGGWAADVGEGGALLSGGERQRVSIARALLKDAPIVLLDEVTSALDPVNEAAVHEGIEHLMAGRTVVMVAHRLRTVRRADRIAFLDGGRIAEEGDHDDLLRRGGRYADFWNVALSPAIGAPVARD